MLDLLFFENLDQSTCTEIPKENDVLNDYEPEEIDNDEYDDDEYENSSNDRKLITLRLHLLTVPNLIL